MCLDDRAYSIETLYISMIVAITKERPSHITCICPIGPLPCWQPGGRRRKGCASGAPGSVGHALPLPSQPGTARPGRSPAEAAWGLQPVGGAQGQSWAAEQPCFDS